MKTNTETSYSIYIHKGSPNEITKQWGKLFHLIPNESFSIRIGLHSIELLDKELPCKSSYNPSCSLEIDCCPQTDIKVLLLKTIPSLNMEKLSQCLYPYILESLVQKVFLIPPKEKYESQDHHKSLDLQWWPACKVCQGNNGTKHLGVTN